MGAALASPTIGSALAEATERLARAGVPEPRADAEVLFAHALGTTRTALVVSARRPLPPDAAGALGALLSRRVGREPVHYLVGEREFWSLSLRVDRRVLVPRPESELVVATALRLAPAARRILDVGTGSGAIAVALACELASASVWASDREGDALAVAAANVAALAPRVQLVRSDLLDAFAAATFDLVVANLPYVPSDEIATLAPEVRVHEPRAALDGGPDGLAVIRALLDAAPAVLVPGGWLVLEVGAGQATAVGAALAGGWTAVETVSDHAGIARVLAARTTEGRRGRWRRS